MATFLQIRKRVNYLIGETNYGTKAQNTIINDHINATIQDIVRVHPFTWDLKTATGTLSTGAFDLGTDYLPMWHLDDARVVTGSQNDDNIFTEIPIKDRDHYTTTDYVYWIIPKAATVGTYTFNSLLQTGSVVHYYHFAPTDLSADTDVCAIPDGESVAYLAASKIYALKPENVATAARYEQEAIKRIEKMYQDDIRFGVNMKSSLDLIKAKGEDGYFTSITQKS